MLTALSYITWFTHFLVLARYTFPNPSQVSTAATEFPAVGVAGVVYHFSSMLGKCSCVCMSPDAHTLKALSYASASNVHHVSYFEKVLNIERLTWLVARDVWDLQIKQQVVNL